MLRDQLMSICEKLSFLWGAEKIIEGNKKKNEKKLQIRGNKNSKYSVDSSSIPNLLIVFVVMFFFIDLPENA